MDEASAVARFTAFADIGEREIALLRSFAGSRRKLDRGEVLRHEGDANPAVFLLLEGWVASSVNFAGGGRQMLKVSMPGDMLGMPSMSLTHTADTIVALSPAVVLGIHHQAMGTIFRENPRLAALLYLIAQEERVMLMDRLAASGRSRAIERVATLILQLHDRYARLDPDCDGVVRHPLTQSDAADLVGISVVHMNRTLQELHERGLLRWRRGSFRILDMAGLRAIGGLPMRMLARDPAWLPEALSN